MPTRRCVINGNTGSAAICGASGSINPAPRAHNRGMDRFKAALFTVLVVTSGLSVATKFLFIVANDFWHFIKQLSW